MGAGSDPGPKRLQATAPLANTRVLRLNSNSLELKAEARYRLGYPQKGESSNRKEEKMIRKLRTLGLALMAVFAISVVAASAASAQNGIFTSDGPATLTGTLTGGANENAWTFFGKTDVCVLAAYTGHEVGSTTNGVPNGATEITLTPHYGTCAINNGAFPTTTDMNGCDYIFALRATTAVADQYNLHTTIKCPAGKHIVTTMFTNAAGHTANTPFCHITITENAAGYAGLKATDTTNKVIDITGTIEGVSADKEIISSTTPDTGILCPKETTNTGIFHIDMSLVAGSTQIGLSHN
jgi:hypothetical protein